MRTYLFVRYGTKLDPNVSLELGLLSCEPIEQAIKTENTIITVFKSNISIDCCKKSLAKYNITFILIDITDDKSQYIVSHLRFDNGDVKDLVLNDDEREKDLLFRIKQNGNSSLTKEEHDFLKTRF